MSDKSNVVITKSDFLTYLDSPRHLWAQKNTKEVKSPGEFLRMIFKQGYAIETLAMKYLEQVILPKDESQKLLCQQTYVDGPYLARTDALVYKSESNSYDLYEIKSGVGVSKTNKYDVTFQALILNQHLKLDHCYLLHSNKEYIRDEEIDLTQIVIAEDVSEIISQLLPEVEFLRQAALQAAQVSDPEELEHCYSPKDCPCPGICHPGLPNFSIYDIPRLTQGTKKQLLDLGVIEAKDVPTSIDLSEKQWLVVERARTNTVHIDQPALKTELEKITFPVYFLDYETCISAVPQYLGYHPQQQIVFQYSLHRLDDLSFEPLHSEHLSLDPGDPALTLLEQLRNDLGETGTIVVWYKPFEKTRNKEMAFLHPQYAEFLEQINERIYDLSDLVNFGYYLHPDFKGSYSIKDVLPAMIPELSYQSLDINEGEQASVTWWSIMFGQLDDAKKAHLADSLRRYCEMDSLAMAELFKVFITFVV
jgi:hypothetical protein